MYIFGFLIQMKIDLLSQLKTFKCIYKNCLNSYNNLEEGFFINLKIFLWEFFKVVLKLIFYGEISKYFERINGTLKLKYLPYFLTLTLTQIVHVAPVSFCVQWWYSNNNANSFRRKSQSPHFSYAVWTCPLTFRKDCFLCCDQIFT